MADVVGDLPSAPMLLCADMRRGCRCAITPLVAVTLALAACMPSQTKVDATAEVSFMRKPVTSPPHRLLLCASTTRIGASASLAEDYFTAGCRADAFNQASHPSLEEYLRTDCPAVEVVPWSGGDCETLCRPPPDQAEWLLRPAKDDELRRTAPYLVCVEATTKAVVHVPLYAFPFGVAACGVSTVARGKVWELSTGQGLSEFVITAEGEGVTVQYILGVSVRPQTEQSATERTAKEICGLFQ